VKNFYEIRNQLLTSIEAQANAKNAAAFAASVATTPMSGQP